MIITDTDLKNIYPNNKDSKKIAVYSAAFTKILPKFEATTTKRIAAFLGQIAVESGELRYDKELPSKWNKKNPQDPNEPVGSLYEGRKLLGNTIVGDGPKYIGRGILQLTGRANYTLYSKKLNLDLVNNPEIVCNPEISTMIACQYFKDRGLFELADIWNLEEITRRVNGNAKLHLKERVAYSLKALDILEKSNKLIV